MFWPFGVHAVYLMRLFTGWPKEEADYSTEQIAEAAPVNFGITQVAQLMAVLSTASPFAIYTQTVMTVDNDGARPHPKSAPIAPPP